jgi:hypothetical protein
MGKQSKRAKATPRQQIAHQKKYEKYRGQPRDVQRLIASFGAEYARSDLARLIDLVARAGSGTALTLPSPKDEWFQILEKAIRNADGSELRRAGDIAKRAHQAIQYPVDPIAIQILDVLLADGEARDGNQKNALSMTVLDFVDCYLPNAASREAARRQVQMIADALGVKFTAASATSESKS